MMNAIFYALVALMLGISTPTISVDKVDNGQQTERTVGEDETDPEDDNG